MCEKNSKQTSGGCICFGCNPALWSSKKKIAMLQQQLENMNEKKKDIEEAIEELKQN